MLKEIKSYQCENTTPSLDEIEDAIKMAKENNCIIEIKWFFPYNGWHNKIIKSTDVVNDVYESLPKRYGV